MVELSVRSREESKLETRRALIQAALAEFAEKGLDAPSLDAICARAGFTRGAFYVHFKNRDDLLAAAMEFALGALVDAVLTADDDLGAAVERYVELAARGQADLGERPTPPAPGGDFLLHQVLAACQRHEPSRARLVAILEEAVRRVGRSARRAQAEGRVRRDADPEALARLLILLALGVRVAADLRVPMPIGPTRDALLALLSA